MTRAPKVVLWGAACSMLVCANAYGSLATVEVNCAPDAIRLCGPDLVKGRAAVVSCMKHNWGSVGVACKAAATKTFPPKRPKPAIIVEKAPKQAISQHETPILAPSGPIFQTGIASVFCNKVTASGETMNCADLVAAHLTLPFGTKVYVTYKGETVLVRIIDRGPYEPGRIIDLSPAAAKAIALPGLGEVNLVLDKPLPNINPPTVTSDEPITPQPRESTMETVLDYGLKGLAILGLLWLLYLAYEYVLKPVFTKATTYVESDFTALKARVSAVESAVGIVPPAVTAPVVAPVVVAQVAPVAPVVNPLTATVASLTAELNALKAKHATVAPAVTPAA